MPGSYELEGKRVLVTGASSGIGAALASAFAEAGATVGICARREDRLREVLTACQQHAPESRMWVTDLADPDAVDQLALDAVGELGGVDVLVNNAGIPKRKHVTALTPSIVDDVMALNYSSPVRLTLALLPQMLDRGDGRIVNIASVAATLSSPGESAYDASKAALSAFSEAIAMDLWDTGVKVLVVYPGLVDTELFSIPDNDPLAPGAPEPISAPDAAAEIVGALRDGRSQLYVPGWFRDVVVGKVNDLDGFMAGTAAWMKENRSP